MIVPSGNGSFSSRYALIALSLPSIARISLRSPASWATEINLQSRYPGGIVIPKIGAASCSACPDAGAELATTPATATNANSKSAIRFILLLPYSRIRGTGTHNRTVPHHGSFSAAALSGVNQHLVRTGGKTHQECCGKRRFQCPVESLRRLASKRNQLRRSV